MHLVVERGVALGDRAPGLFNLQMSCRRRRRRSAARLDGLDDRARERPLVVGLHQPAVRARRGTMLTNSAGRRCSWRSREARLPSPPGTPVRTARSSTAPQAHPRTRARMQSSWPRQPRRTLRRRPRGRHGVRVLPLPLAGELPQITSGARRSKARAPGRRRARVAAALEVQEAPDEEQHRAGLAGGWSDEGLASSSSVARTLPGSQVARPSARVAHRPAAPAGRALAGARSRRSNRSVSTPLGIHVHALALHPRSRTASSRSCGEITMGRGGRGAAATAHTPHVGRAHRRRRARGRRHHRDLAARSRTRRCACSVSAGERHCSPRGRRRRLPPQHLARGRDPRELAALAGAGTRAAGTRRPPSPAACAPREEEVREAFLDPATGEPLPVLLYTGRFLAFKRVPLLVAPTPGRGSAWPPRAARDLGRRPRRVGGRAPAHRGAAGGHPRRVLRRLARARRAAAGPGVRGLLRGPVDERAVRPRVPGGDGLGAARHRHATGGPPSFVNVVRGEPDGWLVPADDEEALADAIVAAVGDAAERRRRGDNGARHVRRTYSWRTIAEQLRRPVRRGRRHRVAAKLNAKPCARPGAPGAAMSR